ncbi:MAG: hypothetical protein ACREMM_07920 [Gemmatimonadales bacterium]
MIPLYVMLAGILAARGAGALGVAPLDDWQAATRAGLALMFVFTGVAHFTRTREALVCMVPPQLPSAGALVTLTGDRGAGGRRRTPHPGDGALGSMGVDRAAHGDVPGQHLRRTHRPYDGRPPADAGPLPILARPTIYATIFVSPSVMVEPHVSFSSISGWGTSLTMVLLGAQLGYLFTPAARNAPYVGANAAFQSISAGGTASGLGLGGAVGYRVRVGTGFAVRLEGHYRRWLNDYDGINEFGFAIGLGGIL